MPNRILRDWTDSDPINELSFQAEVFFVRLIMKVDDFGRFSANPKLLKSLLFPIRDGVRDSDISRDLAACEKAGLIAVYEADGKPYLEIKKFLQRGRAEKSKFPSPTGQVTVTRPSPAPEGVDGDEGVFEGVDGDEVLPQELDSEPFKIAWKDFLSYRKGIKNPLKRDSKKAQLKTLASWGAKDAIESINETIRNGWQGLFKPKTQNANTQREQRRSREFTEESLSIPELGRE